MSYKTKDLLACALLCAVYFGLTYLIVGSIT